MPITTFLIGKLSNFLTPIFLLLNFSANFITGFNTLVALAISLLILSLDYNYFIIAICLWLFYQVLDFSDGDIARINKASSFFGRFIDGLSGVFLECSFLFSLSFFCFGIYASKTLLIFGVIASILAAFDTWIYDRYSALARWSNTENKNKKILPYIRHLSMTKIIYLIYDVVHILIVSMPFIFKNSFYFKLACAVIFFLYCSRSITNIFIHTRYAFIHMSLKSKPKKIYKPK